MDRVLKSLMANGKMIAVLAVVVLIVGVSMLYAVAPVEISGDIGDGQEQPLRTAGGAGGGQSPTNSVAPESEEAGASTGESSVGGSSSESQSVLDTSEAPAHRGTRSGMRDNNRATEDSRPRVKVGDSKASDNSRRDEISSQADEAAPEE